MTNKRALQILVSAAQEKNQVHDGLSKANPAKLVVYTTKELAQAMCRVKKHIKFELS